MQLSSEHPYCERPVKVAMWALAARAVTSTRSAGTETFRPRAWR